MTIPKFKLDKTFVAWQKPIQRVGEGEQVRGIIAYGKVPYFMNSTHNAMVWRYTAYLNLWIVTFSFNW